jgi:hypothetical protein
MLSLLQVVFFGDSCSLQHSQHYYSTDARDIQLSATTFLGFHFQPFTDGFPVCTVCWQRMSAAVAVAQIAAEMIGFAVQHIAMTLQLGYSISGTLQGVCAGAVRHKFGRFTLATGGGRGAQGHLPRVAHAFCSYNLLRRCRAVWVNKHSLFTFATAAIKVVLKQVVTCLRIGIMFCLLLDTTAWLGVVYALDDLHP